MTYKVRNSGSKSWFTVFTISVKMNMNGGYDANSNEGDTSTAQGTL